MDSIPQKKCTKCGESKPANAEYFTKQKNGKFGLYSICRACCKQRDKERYADPTQKQKMKDTHQEWVNSNRDKLAAIERRYYYNNQGLILERERIQGKVRRKRYNERHPERNSNSRAKRRSAIGSHKKSDVELQIKSQKSKCWWCGNKIEETYHVDHRIALNKGGTNWATNICISCPPCNLSKGDKFSWEWNGRLL